MNTWKTCKFGGTSVADADQIRKLEAIVRSDPQRRFVVVSAPGKRSAGDKKVTDLLYLLHETAQNGIDISGILSVIKNRYQQIIDGLELKFDLEGEFEGIAAELTRQPRDFAASRGEYLNGKIVASYLNFEFVDPSQVIFFDEEGRLDDERTYRVLGERLAGAGKFVIPGFYGLSFEGNIKTFSRGGSDISGAVVARATMSSLYENWTDVSGLLMCDPRVVKDPRPMPEVTYVELRELSYMGAQVLHDEAIFPVHEYGIPINIRNTEDPSHPGTMIVSRRNSQSQPIVGVAGKKDFEAIYMNKAMMNREIGFGRKLLEIVESFGINFEHMPSGIDSLSLIVSTKDLAPHRKSLLSEIRKILKVDVLKTFPELSLIAIVGTGMAYHCGIAAKIFQALAAEGINIRLIDQGASELTIIVGVENTDFEKAMRSIYASVVAPL